MLALFAWIVIPPALLSLQQKEYIPKQIEVNCIDGTYKYKDLNMKAVKPSIGSPKYLKIEGICQR